MGRTMRTKSDSVCTGARQKRKTKTARGAKTRKADRNAVVGRPTAAGADGVIALPDELIPVLELERFEPDLRPPQGLQDEVVGSVRYAWLGAGQCGGRLVRAFYELGYRRVLAVNTTRRDLDYLDVPAARKLLMDIGAEGAGKDMSRGRAAVELYGQEILHHMEQWFGRDVEHIMVCFGAGGGTGSGSAVGLVELAHHYARAIGLRNPQRRVGVLMTLPTSGEAASPRIAENAYTVASELALMAWQNKISPLIIIDNDKIRHLHPNLTVKQFWPTVNRTVATLFDVFNRLSYRPSEYTAFDPTDYYSIITTGGCAVMGLTTVRDYHDKFAISRAVRQNLEQTLLAAQFDLSKARVAGSIVVGGRHMMSSVPGLQDAIDFAFDILADITGRATVHRGIYEDDREVLRVYTILGGLPTPTARLDQLRR